MVTRIDGTLYADGWDECMIGHATQATAEGVRVVAVYSVSKILEKIAAEAADHDAKNGNPIGEKDFYLGEAEEFFNFNIASAYIGQGLAHPVFVNETLDIEIDS
jgi:hypothetical protein